jgi:RimJ/RimL family protein N-acetyltransferase
VRDWAWRDGGFDTLVSIIQVGNDRSARVAEKLGGELDRRIVTSFGKDADLYVYRRPG